MKNKILGILLLTLMTSSEMSGQVHELSLQRCKELAEEWNRELQVVDQRVIQSNVRFAMAKTYHLPNFKINAGAYYAHRPFELEIEGGQLPTFNIVDGRPIPTGGFAYLPNIPLSVEAKGAYFTSLRMEQPIYLGGKIRASVKMSREMDDISSLMRQEKVIALFLDTEKLYWNIVELYEKKKSVDAFVKLTEELYRNIEGAVKAGKATKGQQLKVDVKRNEAILMKQKIEYGIELAHMNMARLIGLPLTYKFLPKDSFIDCTPIAYDSLAYRNRAAYKLLLHKEELSNMQIKEIRANYLPQIKGAIGYGYMGGLKLNDYHYAESTLSALAVVDIPVFHWGEGRKRIKIAKIDREITAIEKTDVSEKLKLAVYASYLRIKNEQQRYQMTEIAVEEALENLRISNDFFSVGKETVVNVLEAQLSWYQSVVEQIEARSQLAIAYAEYAQATGKY